MVWGEFWAGLIWLRLTDCCELRTENSDSIKWKNFLTISGNICIIFFHGTIASSGVGSLHYRGYTITLRHTTLYRTTLDEGSSWRRDLYLKTHGTQRGQTSCPWRDSNSKSLQASGRTPATCTAQPLGSEAEELFGTDKKPNLVDLGYQMAIGHENLNTGS